MATKPKRPSPQTNLNFWVDGKQKYKHTQEWTAYNLAQTSEKLMFLDILRELTEYVVVKKKPRGRPSASVQDMIFNMCMLVYAGKSSRRVISELHLCKSRNLIQKVPHFNTILKYMNKKELTKHLQYLITIAGMPLASIEKDFAVDSSGFSTSFSERWLDYKWGKKEKLRRQWRKAHVMSGVKTNIITAIEVTSSKKADAPQLVPLSKTTDNIFSIREVSADAAYLSRKNFEGISQLGGIAFIPFKKNSVGTARGSYVWRRMYEYFATNFDEYMDHYHKRSNSETVFSMIKRKFGNNVRSKNETAQDNEILCKALCHNIVVLVHECFELGINTEFKDYASQIELIRNQICT